MGRLNDQQENHAVTIPVSSPSASSSARSMKDPALAGSEESGHKTASCPAIESKSAPAAVEAESLFPCSSSSDLAVSLTVPMDLETITAQPVSVQSQGSNGNMKPHRKFSRMSDNLDIPSAGVPSDPRDSFVYALRDSKHRAESLGVGGRSSSSAVPAFVYKIYLT
jgi:hypothetical protein